MRVIARSHLRRFWKSRREDSDVAQRDLSTWYKLAEHADWANFGALKQTFGSADQVGDCVVFDVGNNRFRLIGRVFFASGKLYILKVMDHREYDKNRWVDECGCHMPPPRKASAAKTSPSQVRKRRAGGKEGGE
jgi:mRNA interferase HigB